MARRFGMLFALALALAFFLPRAASACGAMLFSEENGAAMSDQQVFIAQAKDRTIVVVSVGYAGAAKDFAFLLPLQKEPLAVIEGEPKFFQFIDGMTTPRVEIIDDTAQPEGSSGCGCFGNSAVKAPGAAGPGVEVQVVQRGETTSYEYVVVGGSSGSSVAAWLTEQGFSAPPEIQADIDDYLAKKWLFLAARLKPSAKSGELAPIEIHYPKLATDAIEYPFRLSRHSLAPGARVGIDLYLAGETMLPANFVVHRVDRKELKALTPRSSNYKSLADRALEGKAFLLQAGLLDLSSSTVFSSAGLETAKQDPPPLSRTYVRYFPDNVALIRLHAELAARDLDDVRLTRAPAARVELDPAMLLHWGSGPPTASLFGVLLGLSLLRRRSRAQKREILARLAAWRAWR
jgi:Uncharacterized protein conserved in bacteria (DUF2330)